MSVNIVHFLGKFYLTVIDCNLCDFIILIDDQCHIFATAKPFSPWRKHNIDHLSVRDFKGYYHVEI